MGSFWAARYGKSISGKDLHDELDPSWRNISDYSHLPLGRELECSGLGSSVWHSYDRDARYQSSFQLYGGCS